MGGTSPAEFDPELAALIQYKVRRLIGHYGFTSGDALDLQQKLYMLTFQAMRRHDAKRAGRKTLADRLVTSKIATIIEGRSAKKRDWRKSRHFQDDAESMPFAGGTSPQQHDQVLDVRDAVSRLPPELREWAAWFSELSEAEIIRQKGQARGKVREMRRRLAEELRRLGLTPEFFD